MVENEEKLERLLRENLKLAKENRRMLRQIRRGMFWGGILRLVIWAIILGVPVILYLYFLQPYVDAALELYSSFGIETGNIESLLNLPNLDILGEQLEGQ